MPITEIETLRASLSYNDVKKFTAWSEHTMINDYLGIGQGTAAIVLQVNENEASIKTNAEDIATNAANFDAHNISNTEHGVTGVNVGTEDFCTELLGGVVLLSDLVADAVSSSATIATADVGVAPGAYSQVYADEQTSLINECKSAHNTLVTDLNAAVTQINDLLAKLKTAKQMNTV